MSGIPDNIGASLFPEVGRFSVIFCGISHPGTVYMYSEIIRNLPSLIFLLYVMALIVRLFTPLKPKRTRYLVRSDTGKLVIETTDEGRVARPHDRRRM